MAIQDIPESEKLRDSRPKINENFAFLDAALAGKVEEGDPRLTDQRTPTDGSVTNQKVAANAGIVRSKLAIHDYRALMEANFEKLLRGTLYTRASPFSQSFSFTGNGTQTAFKIARNLPSQRGWVRGGVSATVGGTSASGTWNRSNQTFTFDSAPSAGAAVVISSTDVVPYQGMAEPGTVMDILHVHPLLLVTTSGTGAAQNTAPFFVPASVKLPLGNPGANENVKDDFLLGDSINPTGFSHTVTTEHTRWVHHAPFRNTLNISAFQPLGRVTLSTPVDAGKRGATGINSHTLLGDTATILIAYGVPLAASTAHASYLPMLCRVVTPGAGSLVAGELCLGVGSDARISNHPLVLFRSSDVLGAFDLFRLHGGPVVEA